MRDADGRAIPVSPPSVGGRGPPPGRASARNRRRAAILAAVTKAPPSGADRGELAKSPSKTAPAAPGPHPARQLLTRVHRSAGGRNGQAPCRSFRPAASAPAAVRAASSRPKLPRGVL